MIPKIDPKLGAAGGASSASPSPQPQPEENTSDDNNEFSRSCSPTSTATDDATDAFNGGVPPDTDGAGNDQQLMPPFKELNTSGGSNNCDFPISESNPTSPLCFVGGLVAGACVNYHMKENEFGNNFKLLRSSDQIKELQTIIRDRNTSRSDFKFYADRLIRLVIEESLNQLPFKECEVTTPTGAQYRGLHFEKGNCGVSIVRSGEAMEQGLRDCCRSIRIGKILVERNSDTHETRVVYARFPEDVSNRKVILMYPIMSSGNTTMKAVKVLKEHQVSEKNIILANLFCTPHAVRAVLSTFPDMKILTSEVHPIAPNHFGTKYFGTD